MSDIAELSLVLYKSKPARVTRLGDKLEIELEDGQAKKVRPKDVRALHPGPLRSWRDLTPVSGDVETAWEILEGEQTDLAGLAELVFDAYTPATALAAWELVEDGLYFQGEPDRLTARPAGELEKEKTSRLVKAADERAWSEFIHRVQNGEILPAERENLSGVEALALGRSSSSRVLNELGRGNTPENAHALLLKLGHWDVTRNPYPARFDLPLDSPKIELPELPGEQRLDLTDLPAFAIDDEDNQDPDDALSWDGERLWVHVADVAALVKPKSALDLEARARAANLYLPEGATPILPPEATELLGLGLQEVSPAFSFGLSVDDAGEVVDCRMTPSWVRVSRMTYAEADRRLDEEPFRQFFERARKHRARRKANGAAMIDLPEVKVRVVDGDVSIRPLRRLDSREMVTEAMLMAGESVAKFAIAQNIAFPFTTQPPPDPIAQEPTDMAGMYAYRRHFKRSRTGVAPEPHAGLGLKVYTRATSPLRRYSDLLAHQQLRAFCAEEELMSVQDIEEGTIAAEAALGGIQRAERLSNQHWTLVYLMRRPDWRGKGVLVDQSGKRSIVMIPELGLEAQVQLGRQLALNDEVTLAVKHIDLPWLSVRFRAE